MEEESGDFGLAANTTTLSAAQLAAYHNLTIDTSRKNTSINASMVLSPRLGVKLDLNHLDQTGSKLMAFGSAAFGSTPAPGGEAVSILPNPTKYVTDTLNLALNWNGDGAHLTAAYFGSFFREGYDRVTFTTFAGANNVQAMSTPPSNDFHQLNLSGGYTLTPTTKLTDTTPTPTTPTPAPNPPPHCHVLQLCASAVSCCCARTGDVPLCFAQASMPRCMLRCLDAPNQALSCTLIPATTTDACRMSP